MPESPSVRLVLFDLGNVLISLRPLEEAFPLGEAAAAKGGAREDLRSEIRSFLESDVFDRFERGQAGKEEFFEAMARRFPPGWSPRELESCYCRILGDEVAGMSELISELKARGIRVAGLTDTSHVHHALFDRYPAIRKLEAVIASCRTGRRKPHPETFRDALQRLRATPGDVYYTDDRPENVEGARSVGIRADVFEGAETLRRHLSHWMMNGPRP